MNNSIKDNPYQSRACLIQAIRFGLIILLSVYLCSCKTVPLYPQKSDLQDGPALPIDGEWMNENKLVVRIKHGEMFTTIPAANGIPAGALLAKDIQRNGAGSFKCAKESYNKNTGVVDYGEGLITFLPK
jgi:hypothetical protein